MVRVATTTGRRLTARVLVGADGAGSRVARALTADDRPPLRLFQAEVPMPPALADLVDGRMVYDFSLMDARAARLPLAVSRAGRAPERGRDAHRHAVAEALGRRDRGAAARGPARLRRRAAGRRARLAGLASRAGGRVAAPHLLCVGDAAGIDALTGEGIAVGLEHGPLAADGDRRGARDGDFRFAGYGAAIDRAVVGRELTLDGRLAKMLYAPRAGKLWLSLIMFDRRVQQLYAARVSGLGGARRSLAARCWARSRATRSRRPRASLLDAGRPERARQARRWTSGRGAGGGAGGGIGASGRAAVGQRTGLGRALHRRGEAQRSPQLAQPLGAPALTRSFSSLPTLKKGSRFG